MKTFLKYICITATVTLLAACSKDELHIPGRTESIEFVMRPTSFNGLDVSTVSTKALLEEEVTEIEAAIYSRYYMIFDKDGNIVQGRTALGIDETSMVLTPNRGTGPFRVCFFANIPTSYLSSISKYSDLSTKRLDFDYADHDETGYIGIPVIDGNMCFPMYGEALFPSEDVTPVNNKVIVPLERLFAKVVLNMKAYFDASIGDLLLDSPNLTIFSYSINNLPKSVLLVPPTETPWADSKSDSYFNNYDIDINDITIDNSNILYDEFTTLPKYSTIYVPEYIIKPIEGAENATDQRLKPTLIDEDKRPVYLSMQAKAHQSNFVDVPLEYKIYLGGNAVNDFSLLRNTRYNNYMTITGTGEAVMGMDHRVEAGYFNLANPDNSGPDEPANCYIISKPGRYLIPMYKGNTTTQLTGVTQAETIDINGSSANTITDAQIVTRDGSEFVLFNANMPVSGGTITPTTVAGGNKLMTVKDQNGNILWSWHLWFCDDDLRPDLDVSMTRYPNNSGNWNQYYVMNRALGATNPITLNNLGIGSSVLGYLASFIGIELNDFVWQDGLYYQWGRKDPLLPTSENIDGSTSLTEAYSSSIKNPQKFYSNWNGTGGGWASEKSINDPCPPGYKVPSNSIWRSSNPDAKGFLFDVPVIGEMNVSTTTSTAYTYNLTQNVSETSASGYIFFPYGGKYGSDGRKQEHISEAIRVTTDANFSSYYAIPTAHEIAASLDLIQMTPKEFRNIVVEFNHEVNHGAFWASDKNSLSYGYATVNTNSGGLLEGLLGGAYRIISCEYQTGKSNYTTEKRQEQVLWWTQEVEYHIYDGTVNWNNNWKTLSEEELSSTNWTLEKLQINNDIPSYLEENGINTEAYIYKIDTSNSPVSGLQVRCVREDSPVQ